MQSGVAYSRQRDVSPAARGGGTRSGREHGEPPTTPAAVPSATTPESGAQGMPSQAAPANLTGAERVQFHRIQREYGDLLVTVNRLSAAVSRQIAEPPMQCTEWEYIEPKMLGIATRIMLGTEPGVSSMRPKHSIIKEEILKSFRVQDSPAHREALDVAWPKVSKSVPGLRSKVVKYFVSRRSDMMKQVRAEFYRVLELGKKPDAVHADPAVVEAWHAKAREYQRGTGTLLYFYFPWN
jgi:hypothetical protein